MKQKIILLFTALLLFGFTQAQISKESYEKAIDLLNCKTVELTLPKENIQQYQQQCPCNKTDFAQLNKFLIAVGRLDATIALSNEIEGLKKSFKENWKKEDIISLLSESIFNDKKYQKIVAFAQKRKSNPEFDNYKIGLKTDLANILTESIPQEISPPTNTNTQQASIEDRISELENKLNTKKEDNGILGGFSDYLILLSILLGALALILSIRKQNSDGSELSNEIKNYVKNKISDATWNRNTPNNNVGSTELRDANNRIRDLESQIEKIKTQLNNSNPISSSTAEITQPRYQEVKHPEVRAEIFYLSSPNADGSFDESSASSTYKEGATIYRFIKIGSNKASFQIDNKEASIKLALQYRDRRIDPVCEATNAFNQAKNISTVQQGEAELQSGKWVVNKKAKIKYEN